MISDLRKMKDLKLITVSDDVIDVNTRLMVGLLGIEPITSSL